MKKTLALLAIATLTGCATMGGGSNTQVFNGQTYTIMKGELGREVSTFTFQNKQSPNQFIIVERNLKWANDPTGEKFHQDWMKKRTAVPQQ